MTFSPKHILVPVALDPDDDLMLAEYAVMSACDIAEKFGSSITLLHLAPVFSPGASAGVDMSGKIYESFMKALKERVLRGTVKLKEWQEAGKNRGIPIEGQVRDNLDSIATVILENAVALKADLLVMGSHGRSGFSRVLFGSVAASVAEKSPIPLLLLFAKKKNE